MLRRPTPLRLRSHRTVSGLRREGRFSIVPENLIRDPHLTDRAVRLWCILDRYAGSNGSAFPSRGRLADDMGCSRDSIDRALSDLCAEGWLRKEQRTAGGVNDYVLLEGGGRTHAEGVAAPMPTGVGTHAAQKEASLSDASEKDLEPSITASGDASLFADPDPDLEDTPAATLPPSDGGFDRFWVLYPRKVCKGAARKAWVKAIKTTPPEVILDGLVVLAGVLGTASHHPDGNFCPHPASWLNAERWTDDPGGVAGQTAGSRPQNYFAIQAEKDAANGLLDDFLGISRTTMAVNQ